MFEKVDCLALESSRCKMCDMRYRGGRPRMRMSVLAEQRTIEDRCYQQHRQQ